MWRMEGSQTVKLSAMIATAGGMKKQSGAKFTENDFDPFAKPPEPEAPESIDQKLAQFAKAHKPAKPTKKK